MSPVEIKSFERPIVQFPSYLKLKRTEGMSYSLNTVAKRMSIVIQRIDTPLVSNMWVSVVFDPVNNWVPQSCISTFVVNLSSQRKSSLLVQSQFHLVEQLQVLLNRSVSIFRRQSIVSFLSHFFS